MRRREVLGKVTTASIATIGAGSVGAVASGPDRLPLENATHVVVDGEKVTIEEYVNRSDTGTLADLESPSTQDCVAPCPGCCSDCPCTTNCICCDCDGFSDCGC